MARILIVEDEQDILGLMTLHLKREGHAILACTSGEEGLSRLKSESFDLAILDWMLPGISGLEICKSIRGRLPILMVTARTEPADIVLGLETGADDYITKPFENSVFLARVRTLLRRNVSSPLSGPSSANDIRIGTLRLNEETHEIRDGERVLELTSSEFKLLASLMKNPGKVFSRRKLIDLIQGEGIAVTERAIDTHVFGLRKKLGAAGEFIETIRGVGYRVKSG